MNVSHSERVDALAERLGPAIEATVRQDPGCAIVFYSLMIEYQRIAEIVFEIEEERPDERLAAVGELAETMAHGLSKGIPGFSPQRNYRWRN